MNLRVRLSVLGVAAALATAAVAAPTKVDPKKFKSKPSGLKYAIIKPGKGAVAKAGQQVHVHYTGWLKDGGKEFDSSLKRGEPLPFTIGQHQVIPGWEEGVAGMKVGEKRQLVIPPKLAYGERGFPGAIPPNSTLVFDVELMKID